MAIDLDKPTDPASLAAFRILFGAVMFFSIARFAYHGWIDSLYIAPAYHFTWHGLDWIQPWPDSGMYIHFAIMAMATLGITTGTFYRLSAAIFAVGFTYTELIDKAPYLNHYYFVSLMATLLIFVPAHRVMSVDASRLQRATNTTEPRRAHSPWHADVGAWALWLLRAQVAIVYFYAGLAKLNGDWLLRGEPLHMWLSTRVEWPLVGPLLDQWWLAILMSWGGALYDLTIPLGLLWSRTRALAFVAVLGFHITTWLLFPIGVFPWVMIVASTLFLPPDWPRKLLARLRHHPTPPPATPTPHDAPPRQRKRLRLAGRALIAAWLTLQILIPLRFLLYPGHVNWTEQGFRFSWRVMLIEKTGLLEYEVHTVEPPRQWTVFINREPLTPLQRKMISTQPDMIHQYAHHIAERVRDQGHQGVKVFAHSIVSFNKRPSQRLIDPKVDLAAEPLGLAHKTWLLPLDPSSPVRE